ncbi:NAD-glutamate dehydrogenase [Rhodoplanes sp. SY1]|uniref:NAD-glutamate dehydrogenase n=1 Tax=Rhodoplanes sp. SY1 TaxID=3166646 RepID=UPI0038B5EDAB
MDADTAGAGAGFGSGLGAGAGSDESRANSVIAAAEAILTARHGDAAAGLAGALFGAVAAEDLAEYDGDELATLADGALAFLAERTPGTPKIRIATPDAVAAPAPVSVIEIVNDDMPFLVDSVLGALREHGLDPLLVAHPVLAVTRDAEARLQAWAPAVGPAVPSTARESLIHIHVERIADAARRDEIVAALVATLADVRLAVTDWRAMRTRLEDVIATLERDPPPLPDGEVAEATAFLRWLLDDNFTFLGMRAHAIDDDAVPTEPGGAAPADALGILRQGDVRVLRRGREMVAVTPEVMEFLQEPKALIITKANARSRVHRRVHMDYVGIKRFDASGRVVGELRLVGLFTATAYTRSARGIPYLRRKVEAVLARAGFAPASHSARVLANVLETYPRDELFQVDEATLLRFSLIVMHLGERPRVRVLPRLDRFDRFVSVIVYVPRDRYDSTIREAIGAHLAAVYTGRIVAFYPWFPDGPLVRVHYIVGRFAGETPRPSRAALEEAVSGIVLTWQDRLAAALAASHEPVRAAALKERYAEAFSRAYRTAFTPSTAVDDIKILERLTPERPLGVDFYRNATDAPACARLKVWSQGRPIPLSERVPVLEHMGFRVVEESTFRVATPTGDASSAPVWLHDMQLERLGGGAVDLDLLGRRLEAVFLMAMRGLAEDDGYNALALVAAMPWRDIALVRMLSRALRQFGVSWSQDYMWATLTRHPAIAERIVALFHARFAPRQGLSVDDRADHETEILHEIDTALDAVESLDEDRILRRFVNLVLAAVRTTYYQLDRDGLPKPVMAIKFDSRRIDDLPLPRPLYEVFVYSPRLEAVHLRFGKVARGGIRWSDRPQDFRTEVLGLVKAQQVKNAVIVPVGAKGGFVPKQLPVGGSREAVQAEAIASYELFMGALLDLTDTIAPDGRVIAADTVRHDGDDPYLVVAADKGTATFSDIANGIAQAHGFWLDDAFASGGSAGYDHKVMGITARGAWEAVKRHFREMNVDIGKVPFTAVGVGDMSGDVFGNGMLRERTTKLIAAFDHRDIFIDPTPDPERSFAERARLFALPRSSWQDYDTSLISSGGGVFPRSAKEITLSPQAQAAIGLKKERVTPTELMSAILKAPVDLLFFGGIGTYVRAPEETNDQAGDRANDAIRITGPELRCKVVGEGANLGLTQRGRISAALAGVRLNTDAIDNSAGVNTSDVEVNLKIALGRPLRDGRLDRPGRDTLLASLTDDVGRVVLRNNYQQTQALSLAQRRGLEDLGFQQRLMQTLERRGLLDRAVEMLPDDVEIAERRSRGVPLTRPELAVLLAYAKLSLSHDLLESSIPDDAYLSRELGRYFPPVVGERFPDALTEHRLRRDIIVTQLANSMINRGGPTLIVRIADQTGAAPDRIAAAFAAVRDSFDMVALNTAIEALDNRISGDLQLALLEQVQNLLLDRMVWVLRRLDLSGGLAGIVDRHRAGIAAIEAALDHVLPKPAQVARAARTSELAAAGVPEALAQRLADMPQIGGALDAIRVADRVGRPVEEAAATWFAVAAHFDIDRLSIAARKIVVADYFDRLALDRALDQIGDAARRITAETMADGLSGPAAVEAWTKARGGAVDRVRVAVQEIAASGLTLSRLSVAASFLGDLAPG